MSINEKLYKSYTDSPLWIKKCDKIISERGNNCEICGKSEHVLYAEPNYGYIKLEVHHKNYDNITEEKNSDLLVVCDRCHNYIHTISKGEYSIKQEDINEGLKLVIIKAFNDKEKDKIRGNICDYNDMMTKKIHRTSKETIHNMLLNMSKTLKNDKEFIGELNTGNGFMDIYPLNILDYVGDDLKNDNELMQLITK